MGSMLLFEGTAHLMIGMRGGGLQCSPVRQLTVNTERADPGASNAPGVSRVIAWTTRHALGTAGHLTDGEPETMTRSSSLVIGTLIAAGTVAATAPPPATAQAESRGQRYVVAAEGNEARFRVREQLLGFDLPSDAVGVTSRVSGAVFIDGVGRIVGAGSRIVVDLSDLTSDSDRRDGFIKRRTLDTENHPEAVFSPHRIIGLDGSLPATGEATFRVAGDMTVRGETRQVVWDVTARRDGSAVVGTATTRFPFSRFDLDIPRVRSVLSVDDDIRLEYDFRFIPGD